MSHDCNGAHAQHTMLSLHDSVLRLTISYNLWPTPASRRVLPYTCVPTRSGMWKKAHLVNSKKCDFSTLFFRSSILYLNIERKKDKGVLPLNNNNNSTLNKHLNEFVAQIKLSSSSHDVKIWKAHSSCCDFECSRCNLCRSLSAKMGKG